MFAKLLKYDYRATRRYGFACLIAIGVATLLGSLVLLFLCNFFQGGTEGTPLFQSITAIGSMLLMYGIIFVISLTNTVILVICMVHYYKNLVTDEGYLTFTLPVKVDHILLAKFTNSTLWALVIGAATILSFVIMASVGLAYFDVLAEFADITRLLASLVSGTGVAILIFAIIFSLLSLANTHLLYYMAIFLGSVIAKKNKALAAIGCVLGVNFIYSSIYSIIYSIFVTSISLSTHVDIALLVLLIIGCIVMAGLDFLFYYLTRRMMHRSLNLP